MNNRTEELNYDVWANHILLAEDDDSFGLPKYSGTQRSILHRTLRHVHKGYEDMLELPFEKSPFKKDAEFFNYVHATTKDVQIGDHH